MPLKLANILASTEADEINDDLPQESDNIVDFVFDEDSDTEEN